MSGVIFRDPQEKEEQRAWKTADEYLSGNVRDKLRMAHQSQMPSDFLAVLPVKPVHFLHI